MRFVNFLNSISYMLLSLLKLNVEEPLKQQRSLAVVSSTIDIAIDDISIELQDVQSYDVNGCVDPSGTNTEKYSADIFYSLQNVGDADFFAPSAFVDFAQCGTPAILNFLDLKIEGDNTFTAINLNRYATCVSDDSNSAACTAGGSTTNFAIKPSPSSMVIKKGASYGISKKVHARFPLTLEQFNALKVSTSPTLKFTLSVNKYLADGATGVVSVTLGSKLQGAMVKGDSKKIFTVCDNLIEPNPGTTTISGYENEQSLKYVCISTKVQSIADNAFHTTMIDPSTGYEMDVSSSLTSLRIPSTVKTIGREAFRFSQSLQRVIFQGSVDTIGVGAFIDTSMTSLTFAGNVGAIEGNAFSGSNGITSLKFSGSVGSIGVGAFTNDWCNIASITFGGPVGSIEYYAFGGCKLTTVTFPAGLTSIGEYAFQLNRLLKTVTFLGEVTTIRNNAFAGCDALKTVYYPSSWAIPKNNITAAGVTFVAL